MLVIKHYHETNPLGKYRCCELSGTHDETEGKAEAMILSGNWVEMYRTEINGSLKITLYGGQAK